MADVKSCAGRIREHIQYICLRHIACLGGFQGGDTAQAAKAITTFNKEHEVLTYKGGFMEATVLDEAAFKSIAKLPGREVLNGQLAGVVASPLTGLVRGLGSMIQGLALQLGQIAEKGLVSGEAPAAEEAAPAEEEPKAEAEEPAAEKAEEAPAEEAPTEAASGNEPPADQAEAPEEEPEAKEDTSEQDSNEEEG